MKKSNNTVGPRQLSEATVLRLGRTLRRFSRTSRELMRILDLKDEEVRIPRKKKRPVSKKPAETQHSAEIS